MSHVNLEPGMRLGDFRIEGRLGTGGMGVVYRARQLSLNRVVALKVLNGSFAHPNEIARFHRAAQAAARLRHPNLAAIYTVGEDEGLCHLAMEYIDGASFQQVVARLAAAPYGVRLRLPAVGNESKAFAVRAEASDQQMVLTFEYATSPPSTPAGVSPTGSDLPPLDLLNLALDGPPSQPVPTAITPNTDGVPTTDLPGTTGPGPALSVVAIGLLMQRNYHLLCCEWVRDAARGVQHAHGLGVIHRDLKPGNLMLSRDGQVKVIDFGLARCFEDATLTSGGQLVGTPLYMSPEQVTGRIELSGKTDIYALGLILYELLTLGPPITARNREELFQRIIAKPLEPLTSVNFSVSSAIEAVVHKATAKDPDDRYETAGAFADDLERVLAGKPIAAPTYKPREDEAQIANARPALIPTIAAQFYVGAFFWILYASMLLSTMDALGRGRVLWPLESLGWFGGASAWALFAFLWLAAMMMSNGYRWGYWMGLIGQLILIASFLLFANWLRATGGLRLIWYVILSAVVFLWQAWQLGQYCRRPVRSWFDFVQRLRQRRSPGSGFRDRFVTVPQS